MKKLLTILSISCLSLGAGLKAQSSFEDPRDLVSFGIKAGVNVSNVWDAQGQDFSADPKVGFAGGVFLGIPIGTYLGFQPEVLLSQKGFQASGILLGSYYEFQRTTTYIDVPLQFQVKPAEFLTLLFGPQYSYLVHATNTYTVGSNTFSQQQEFENDNVRKNIFGVVGGADININHIVVSGRMGWDLVNNNGDGTSTTPRYKNRWIQLTLGFKI